MPQGPPNDAPRSVLEVRCVPVLRAVADAPGLSRLLAPTAASRTVGRSAGRGNTTSVRVRDPEMVGGVHAPAPGPWYQVTVGTGPHRCASRGCCHPAVRQPPVGPGTLIACSSTRARGRLGLVAAVVLVAGMRELVAPAVVRPGRAVRRRRPPGDEGRLPRPRGTDPAPARWPGGGQPRLRALLLEGHAGNAVGRGDPRVAVRGRDLGGRPGGRDLACRPPALGLPGTCA